MPMPIMIIHTENDLLDRLEKMTGLGGSMITTRLRIANKIGLKFWSKPLQKKLDLLERTNRILIERAPRKHVQITILKPLTGEEKQELSNSVIFDEIPKFDIIEKTIQENILDKEDIQENTFNHEIFENENNIPELTIEEKQIFEDKEYLSDSTKDIDILFDDITEISRNMVKRYKEIKDENAKLQLEVEIYKQREKKWMTKAIELQNGLRR